MQQFENLCLFKIRCFYSPLCRVGAFFFIIMNMVYSNLDSIELLIREKPIFVWVSQILQCFFLLSKLPSMIGLIMWIFISKKQIFPNVMAFDILNSLFQRLKCLFLRFEKWKDVFYWWYISLTVLFSCSSHRVCNFPVLLLCVYFRHGSASGYYRVSVYFLAKIFGEFLPYRALSGFLFGLIAYWMAGNKYILFLLNFKEFIFYVT